MKRCVAFLMALLFAISWTYRSSATDETGQIARDLNEMEERCVRDRLLTGWGLDLEDLTRDLNPEEEIVVDMALEL